jgi:hypothetical protein
MLVEKFIGEINSNQVISGIYKIENLINFLAPTHCWIGELRLNAVPLRAARSPNHDSTPQPRFAIPPPRGRWGGGAEAGGPQYFSSAVLTMHAVLMITRFIMQILHSK